MHGLPINTQNFMQKDLTKVKIFRKVSGGGYFFWSTLYNTLCNLTLNSHSVSPFNLQSFLLTVLTCSAPAVNLFQSVTVFPAPSCGAQPQTDVKDTLCTHTDKTYIAWCNICANDFYWLTANLTMCQKPQSIRAAMQVTALMMCEHFWLLNKEYLTNLHKFCVDL